MFKMKTLLTAIFLCSLVHQGFSQSGVAPIRVEGSTMGTTYSVLYFDPGNRNFKTSIDSLLREVNRGINNYDPISEVSRFNHSTNGISSTSQHFLAALEVSLDIAKASYGHFDPSVYPLVNLWGFGPAKTSKPSQARVDSIRKFVGYQHIRLDGQNVGKDDVRVAVDFGGIGQGYGVDVIARFLDSQNVKDYLVELGGEGFASGKNLTTGRPWRVGILDPMAPKDDPQLLGYALAEDRAFTTSGNYFNYRIINGRRYGHTISPFTGFPIQQDIISVSVFASDCATADAWATAFMVAGKDKAIEFLKGNPDLAAILVILQDGKPGYVITENIREKVFLESNHDH